MNSEVIWVNEKDEVIGYGEKIETHRIEQLHRAFSLFIIDEQGKILIQRRAKGKYHSGGLLSNACCSHPYKGESWKHALQRCMIDELGATDSFHDLDLHIGKIDDHLEFKGKFIYYSKYKDLSEHEYDHVFIYYCDEDYKKRIKLNKEEVEEIYWFTKEELQEKLKDPSLFTTWFPLAYQYID